MRAPLGILFFTIGIAQFIAIDYCDPKVCPYQGKHIRCQNDGSFSKTCPANATVVDILPFRRLILKEHRMYRNILAEGNLKCFYPAARMPAMKWDNNLAENAVYHVKSCTFAHDKCRSTTVFTFAGQNIYTINTKELYVPIERYIEEAIFLWTEEFMFANYSVMESFVVTKPQTGHFTLVMNDRNTHVGCAFLDSFKPGKTIRRFILFTCNYSSTNIRGYPSYRAGKPASRCKKIHRYHKFLCADKDINANDITWYNK